MSGNIIANTDPAIRATVYSDMLMKQLEDGFLPEGLHRDVSDFGDGSLLQIPTIGQMPLFDIAEGEDTPLSAMDTGTVTLQITEHKGTGGYVSDELKEDGYKAAAVEAEIVPQSLRSIKESYETDFLSQINSQTANDENAVNNFAHRIEGSGTNSTLALDDLAYLKAAFDKANVPDAGRILIVDPIVELTLNSLVGAQAFTNNPMFEGMVGEGFAKGRKFVRNIFGWDIWVSNRLARATGAESISHGGAAAPVGATSTVAAGDIFNVAMCVADDSCKPFMGAWRRMPRVEGERNISKRRDEFHVTARWGFGTQRLETAACLVTSATQY
jgi:hypothetical protein